MPNDNPDWSVRNVEPAQLISAFNAPANALTTLGPYNTAPGTHAGKVYGASAAGIVWCQHCDVYDATLGNLIAHFPSPPSPNLVWLMDDISVPSFEIQILTFQATGCQGSILNFQSDQAVAIDNLISNPLPVLPILGLPANFAASLAAGASTSILAAGTMFFGILGGFITVDALATTAELQVMDHAGAVTYQQASQELVGFINVLAQGRGSGDGGLSIKNAGNATAFYRGTIIYA